MPQASWRSARDCVQGLVVELVGTAARELGRERKENSRLCRTILFLRRRFSLSLVKITLAGRQRNL
jgi:hypothetical protein